MSLKNDFEILYVKYKSIISLKEFTRFTKQLNKVGYRLILKRQSNNIVFCYEKPSIFDLFKRVCDYFKNRKLELCDYQKRIYKI